MKLNPRLSYTLLFFLALGAMSCGVKGDPEPPGTPVQIGRGRPAYKGLEEGLPNSPFGPTDTSEAEKVKRKTKGEQ